MFTVCDWQPLRVSACIVLIAALLSSLRTHCPRVLTLYGQIQITADNDEYSIVDVSEAL